MCADVITPCKAVAHTYYNGNNTTAVFLFHFQHYHVCLKFDPRKKGNKISNATSLGSLKRPQRARRKKIQKRLECGGFISGSCFQIFAHYRIDLHTLSHGMAGQISFRINGLSKPLDKQH